MGKKKNRAQARPQPNRGQQMRRLAYRDQLVFEKLPRDYRCLAARKRYQQIVRLDKLNYHEIKYVLGVDCMSIEHQIIALRTLTRITENDLSNRRELIQNLMDCLYDHHGVIYEAILFGSSINGLGFKDSDLDFRLRPLVDAGHRRELEPIHYNQDLTERTLKNIAFQTTRCAPTDGCFVASARCPIARLNLFQGFPIYRSNLIESFSCDISLMTNSLGPFNSLFIRFLCKLSPKFHLLAVVVRYWYKVHELNKSGQLSSYALINLLIVFCQSLDKPLLPTVDKMRDIQIAKESCENPNGAKDETRAMSQLEWQCLVCLDKESYPESENNELLAVLLLKFFEFLLKLTYGETIITIRSGRALTKDEFIDSSHYHPVYPITNILNIQDPFDLKHNLTKGMTEAHFQKVMVTISRSYETLHQELLNNFLRPKTKIKDSNLGNDSELWGLNAIFVEASKKRS